jgi:hypothetical protein
MFYSVEATIEAIQAMLARREAGENARIVEASPSPDVVPGEPNMGMVASDTALGVRKRKPRKVPSPGM